MLTVIKTLHANFLQDRDEKIQDKIQNLNMSISI